MRRPLFLWLVAMLLIGAALALWLRSTKLRDAHEGAVVLEGVAEALPRAEPAAEYVLPEALDAARAEVERDGGRALVVHRHGHRVFEYFAADPDRERLIDGGGMAAAVMALALQQPEEAATADAGLAATLVRDRVWLPLRAGESRLWLRADQMPRDCCIQARVDDWMRVADLLLGVGTYHGERFLPADAVRTVLAGSKAPPWQGDEPLLARDGRWFDLEDGVRIWLAPQRQMAMLTWGRGASAQDPLIPNIVLRGLTDAAPAVSGDISDFVPGH